ncbi:hypothetical protein JY96_06385 [Aquabacterium sp. NJ1]|nr:hypothetical protein JY96_06385 [Aquabacterium sp. NJ1]
MEHDARTMRGGPHQRTTLVGAKATAHVDDTGLITRSVQMPSVMMPPIANAQTCVMRKVAWMLRRAMCRQIGWRRSQYATIRAQGASDQRGFAQVTNDNRQFVPFDDLLFWSIIQCQINADIGVHAKPASKFRREGAPTVSNGCNDA